jgi:FtsH-binding integral membrane protein
MSNNIYDQPQNYNKEHLHGGDYYDAEMNNAETIRKQLRLGFIKKVYSVLSLQLAITIAFVALSFIDSVQRFYIEWMNPFFWIAMVGSICIAIPLICFKRVAKKVPTNYILLISWTICESYMVGTLCAFVNSPQTVIIAGLMTTLVTVALTIYACTTKTDFTFCMGFLWAFSMLMICWGLFFLIFRFYVPFLHTLYCVLGVMLYSIYLIYDTQLVMGKFGFEYSIEDYIIAAMMIYIDVIQIFIYLLSLLSRK